MAVVAFSIEWQGRNAAKVTWAGLEDGDTGQPVSIPELADRTVQVSGTFGSGGEVTMEGSMTDEYASLTDYDGNEVAISDTTPWMVKENTTQIRPNVTGGDGTTALTVEIQFA